ncbi:amino acid ABC transporter substrate-binding protein [Marichromatium bheemlicum]|uniref:Amino acid ABC transporter substrate-binding protein n=1 Tax=Marichromatium bheemlicum TaxID=365339 RepID=A0ABX1I573_9GAMM|nr:amino acid ABC transporter substrate-binding protein [Marichromatium bheemlicum]NKN32722.1 amino acid ABC transporter substrate-binding protein [Marichromatium bheemlicum]
MQTRRRWLIGLILATALGSGQSATLDEVRDRGELRCGVNGEVPGLSHRTADGHWEGLDVDFCRAVSAAVLGTAERVRFVTTTPNDRLARLRAGDFDILARNTSWTLARDTESGVAFVGVLYHDGQGFMVRRDSHIHSALELDGRRVCVITGTTGPHNARAYSTRHRMHLRLVPSADIHSATRAYLRGECDALSSDQSQLFAVRSTLRQGSAEHRILTEVISKEPLSPAVRDDDPRWFDIVRWTLFVLIDAEEQGIDSQHPSVPYNGPAVTLFDDDAQIGARLGLSPGWSRRIISQVGNYAELFERNLGIHSPLQIKRGLNALWRDGGILYAPPSH